jgi:TolB-like protein
MRKTGLYKEKPVKKAKKLLPFIVLPLIITCASVDKADTTLDTLDAAIRKTSDYLNEKLPGGIKLVFLNFRSEWPELSEYIIEGLVENAVNDVFFTVVDRQNLALIRQEMDFQLSGEVSDETAQSIGKKLGAQIIVSGSIVRIGGIYRLRVRAITVETAHIQGQFSRNIQNDLLINDIIAGYGSLPAMPPDNPRVLPGTPAAGTVRGPPPEARNGPSAPAVLNTGITMFPVLERRTHFVVYDGFRFEDNNRDMTFEPFMLSATEIPFEAWFKVFEWARERGYVFSKDGRENSARQVYGIDTPNAFVWCNALSEYTGVTPYYNDPNGIPLRNAGFQGSFTAAITAGAGFWEKVKRTDNNGYRLPTYWEAEVIHKNLGLANIKGILVDPHISGYTLTNVYGGGWTRTDSSGPFRVVQTITAGR